MVGPDTEICPIMKADAYGCGIDLCIPTMIRNDIQNIGVTSNEEARCARNAGFDRTIMRVRTATASEIESGSYLNIEELIGNIDNAKEINDIAAKQNKKISFHLALNSGDMSRNGIEMSQPDSLKQALEIVNLPNLELKGIMTHFSLEEEDIIKSNLNDFRNSVNDIVNAANIDTNKIKLHTANSYATLHVPESRLDMVRCGDAIYESMGNDFPQFKDVFSFKSRVSAVNTYPKGATTGYDNTYTLTRESKLANIPVGFNDGYTKDFSNKGHVIINGHLCNVVGKISMNTFMVDVTDFPDIQAGDEVILYGADGINKITHEEIKEITGSEIFEMMIQ